MNTRRFALAVVSLVGVSFLAPSNAGAQSTTNSTKPKTTDHVKPSYKPGGTNSGYKTTSSAQAAKAARARSNAQVKRNYNAVMSNFGTAVAGGNYMPGYGVMGSQGTPVFGGSYMPGYGVTGVQPTAVHGGTYMPGYGVSGTGSQKVHGGTYTPGFGVR
jgi:hypothetical protein